MIRASIIAASALLTACATRPVCDPIRVPVPVETERLVVEPIPAELLREHPVATGDLRHCPRIAAHNLEELRACNDDKAAIRAKQGAARDE